MRPLVIPLLVGLRQRQVETEAFDQVRIGDIWRAERHQIGMTRFEHGARRRLRQAPIGHDDAVVQGTETGGRAASERFHRGAAQVGGRVVDLQVSKLGKGLAKTLQPVCAWGSENMEEIGAISSARAIRNA